MKLLTFSNYVPEQIADIVRFDSIHKSECSFRHTFFCQYLKEFISQVADDAKIDGAVIPCTCDSARSAAAYLRECGKYIYEFHIPIENATESVAHLTQTLIDYKTSIERYFCTTISNEQIAKRCEVVRNRGRELFSLYMRLPELSYADYLSKINTMLKSPLSDWQMFTNIAERKPTEQRVIVIGSFINDFQAITDMQNAGLTIVCDNVTNSKRLPKGDFATTPETVFSDIARDILETRMSPVLDRLDNVFERDLLEIKQKQVKAVIFLTQKYCEPYDFLFALYKPKLEQLDIPCFKVIQSDKQNGQNKVIFETIAAMIGGEV